MKKVIVIISISVVVIFLGFQWAVASNTNSTGKYQYKVNEVKGDVEFRTYQEAVFARVRLEQSDFKSMSYKGFGVLADFIFGNNQQQEKIAMTSPVLMEMNQQYTMEFMMPSDYDLSTLPVPNNSDIEVVTRLTWKAASIRFGGYADDEKIDLYIDKLKEALRDSNIKHRGNFKFLGYNPPYQVLNRINEVVVEIE